MRSLIATLLAAAVIAGSALIVAGNVDTAAAEQAAWRARLAKALATEANGDDCGCTAAIRAKDRQASRTTTDAGSAK